MITRNTQIITGILILLVSIILFYLIIGRSKSIINGDYTYLPVKVALAKVALNEAPRLLSGIGELEAGAQVQVTAETNGLITKITFDSGKPVSSGELLVQLNDAPEQAEKMRLEAQRHNAQQQYSRFLTLSENNATTKEQLDNALATLNMTKGELQRIDALIAQKAIHAPFTGIMGIRNIHLGQYLNSGDPIANLVDMRVVHANFTLDEKVAPELSINQNVAIHVDALPEAPLKARITAIDPLIGRSRMVQVQATLDQIDPRLKAGMFIKAAVKQPMTTQVLTIPETAITYTAYGERVFIIDQSQDALTVKSVTVRVGERWQGLAEIESGVTLEDYVVTSGQLKLQEGTLIEALPQDSLTLSATESPLQVKNKVRAEEK